MPSTSRWLVGSSIRRMSGGGRQLARDREALFQPPDRVSTLARPSANPARLSACARRPGRSFLVHSGERGHHDVIDRSTGGKHGILRNIAHAHAVAEEA